MSKRSAQTDAADSPVAKQARIDNGGGGGGAAGSAMSCSSSRGGAAIGPPPSLRSAADTADHLTWSIRREVHALKLRALMRSSAMGSYRHARSVIDLLEEDAARPQPLIHLAYVAEGDSCCLLFHLLRLLPRLDRSHQEDYSPEEDGSDDEENESRLRGRVKQLIHTKLLPLMPQLLRSFDAASRDAATGQNALHEVCALTEWGRQTSGWLFALARQLIALGVDIDARDHRGRTPLLSLGTHLDAAHRQSASRIRLLQRHGADIDAQDSDGNGLLHLLAQNGAWPMLLDLFDGGRQLPDSSLRNAAGQTAADLAAIRSAQSPHEPDAENIRLLLSAHQRVWRQHGRALLLCECAQWLIPDLAALVMAFVDGSGPSLSASAVDASAQATSAVASAENNHTAALNGPATASGAV